MHHFARRSLVALALPASLLAGTASAAVMVTPELLAAGYSQDFNSLPVTGVATTMPNSWVRLQQEGGAGAQLPLVSGNGSAQGNAVFYSYGSAGSPDRALGSGGPATQTNVTGGVTRELPTLFGMLVSFTNRTSAALSSFSLLYDSEVWRNGGSGKADSMWVEYVLANQTNYPGTTLAWTNLGTSARARSPGRPASAAHATNGNSDDWRQADLGATVNGLDWANGQTLFLRFVNGTTGVVGREDGMAIDNVRVSFAATPSNVPEPGSAGLLAAALGALAWSLRRKGH